MSFLLSPEIVANIEPFLCIEDATLLLVVSAEVFHRCQANFYAIQRIAFEVASYYEAMRQAEFHFRLTLVGLYGTQAECSCYFCVHFASTEARVMRSLGRESGTFQHRRISRAGEDDYSSIEAVRYQASQKLRSQRGTHDANLCFGTSEACAASSRTQAISVSQAPS